VLAQDFVVFHQSAGDVLHNQNAERSLHSEPA
jgi:hypothetical protein